MDMYVSRRAGRLASWWGLLFSVLFSPSGLAQSDIELPVLNWAHDDRISTHGDFTLVWEPGPDNGNYDFARIEEYDPARDEEDQWWPHFVTGNEQTFATYLPGEWFYRLRARQAGGLHWRGTDRLRLPASIEQASGCGLVP